LRAYRALTSTIGQNLIARPGTLEDEKRRRQMSRFLFVLPLVLVSLPASAQQGHDACARDVSRLCRAVMNEGDMAVLNCLKQHRARVSRACDKVLTEHGQ
jgi:cysteine rich repeat protein